MKRFKNILVATDSRFDAHPIVAYAADIAVHNQASLKIVDVVPDFSWAVRHVLKNHTHMRELVAKEKSEVLEELAAGIREQGIDVTTKVLMGQTSVELIREVLRDGHDLVMRATKGSGSRRKGFFGSTAVRLLRKTPCAVWLVAAGSTPDFQHVLGCVDTSTGHKLDAELNDIIFELASSISHYHDGRFSILHAWSVYAEQILRGRMEREELADVEKSTQEHVAGLLDKFLGRHGSSIREENVHLVKGEVPDVITEFARQNGVDLVVMGTVARAGLAGMLMGSVAESILSRIECSVLALKPSSFVSPVRLE